jgi:uncharacterized protein (TIGR01319 family)
MMKAQSRLNAIHAVPDLKVTRPEESVMVVDCGTSTTKAVLLDVVDGQYRLVAYSEAPSTADAPWEDISIGAIDAIRRLEVTMGRAFLDAQNQLISPEQAEGSGVDCFLAVSSAAKPLRVLLSGLVRDVSLASARRAALSTYATLAGVLSLEQTSSADALRTADDDINAIWHGKPDVVCLVGGTDGGASGPVLDMVQNTLRVALYLMGDQAPPVIYAGNSDLRESVAQQLGEVTTLQAVDNVRPSSDAENIGPLREELEVMFYEQRMQSLPGLRALERWTPIAILPTARAADYMLRYCERVWKSQQTALRVDIGSASVTLNVCRQGQSLTTIRTDLGMGSGLLGLLGQVELSDIVRWLPYEITESQAHDRLLNKTLHPHTIPQSREDLLLEQAAAREALRLALMDSFPGWPGRSLDEDGSASPTGMGRYPMIPPCEPLIAGGSVLAHAPSQGLAALILLDALQPTGISTLYLDEHNLMPSLGVAANVNPLATVQTLRNNGLTYLGTVVVPVGRARPGDKVLTIRPADQPSSAVTSVTYGNLAAIPFQDLEPGTVLEIIPTRGFDVGRGPGKSVKVQYRGGTVGLIVDARGRPLELADKPEAQRQRMESWLWEMTSA